MSATAISGKTCDGCLSHLTPAETCAFV
jgi:hypothetical protein